jgi:type I site-specific restriction-modification system R (restriction) subunit
VGKSTYPKKHDVFVLDFMNTTEVIEAAFADYYRTTILSEETDPNKLPDLKTALDGYQVYAPDQVNGLVELYLGSAPREKLDAILDVCVATYLASLDEDGQVDFKGKAKAFTRTYDFLASILPYTNAGQPVGEISVVSMKGQECQDRSLEILDIFHLGLVTTAGVRCFFLGVTLGRALGFEVGPNAFDSCCWCPNAS